MLTSNDNRISVEPVSIATTVSPKPPGEQPGGSIFAEALRDKYTFKQPCCVDGEPDAHTVWLKVGNQSFQVNDYCETAEDADWMRLMLGKAMETLVKAEAHR